jgi:two-component system cell cycle sensor histidine kinase/response regulator CckA
MNKILVVDNDQIIRRFMSKLLEKERCKVVTAEDGLNALDILKTYTPDIIFVDLVMPNINGEILCRTIRGMKKFNDTYLVILSAIAAEEQVDLAQLGVNACIAKGPFNEMAQNILAILEQLEHASSEFLSEEIIGIESIYPRAITEELLTAKRHFEIIIERMSDGVLEINSEGRVVYANPFALSLTGIPEKKLLGFHFIDVFSGDDRQRVCDLMEIADVKPKIITEDHPLRLNRNQITLNILPLDEDGFASIIILNDVSERKRMEYQLQQSQKMEAIGTLASGIAHDFNNLLMGIQGWASLMLIDTDPSHPHFEYIEGIERTIKNAAGVTKQLLGLARGGKYELKPTDLNELIKSQNLMFGRTRKEIKIRDKYDENLWVSEVDQSQIKQILLNLYINAWQAMPGGGDLYIQTENVILDEDYVKPYKVAPGKYVKISVADTGIGMDEATQKRIFDPFYTTKEIGLGTGLGLASAYGVIKNHGGFINVYSEKGEGTTFDIYLPASEKEVLEDKKLIEELLKGDETVLLVDDEDMIIDVSERLLGKLGYKVLIARSGKDAIKTYKTKKDYIDMVILDIIMLDMSGGDLYDKLKEINPAIKVLLSSGYSINGQATGILERGCDGFIQKPFNVRDLSQKIREILDKD